MSAQEPTRLLLNDLSGHPFQIQLSRELAKRGYVVMHTHCTSLLTPKGNLARNENDSIHLDIRDVTLDVQFEKYALLHRWRHERELGRKLAQIVRDFSPDIVISSNTPLGTQAILQSASHQGGAGFLFWMQDALGVGYRTALRRRLSIIGNLLGKTFQIYERLLVAKSDATVVITDDFVPYLPKSAHKRNAVTVIENWAPLDELPLMSKSNEWSHASGLAETTNFLYSGTLGLKHNPALLYRLAQATSMYPNVRVVVISEGPGAEWLAARQRQEKLMNLILMPFQPFDKMPEVLASADGLVALLEKEAGPFAVPSKVLTYLCAKRPLLLAVPSENLSAKIVRRNHAGLAVEPDDIDGFIAAALEMLGNPKLMATLAENGRAYAERAFDINEVTDKFERVIARINAHRNPHRAINDRLQPSEKRN